MNNKLEDWLNAKEQKATPVPKTRYRWMQWGRDSAYNKYYRCSNCKHEIIVYSDDMYGGIEIPNTCEHCGAKMFTKEEEE